MIKYIAILFAFSFPFIAQAQQFEGIVNMTQTNAKGEIVQLTWYFKEGKVVYDLAFKMPDGNMTKMRFIPNPSKNVLLMTNPERSFSQEIPVQAIETPSDLKNGMMVQEDNSGTSNAHFEKVYLLKAQTLTTNSDVEVAPEVDVNWAIYAPFFGKEYGVAAILKAGKKGFPIAVTTKNPEGKMIQELKVTSVTRKKLDDSIFQ